MHSRFNSFSIIGRVVYDSRKYISDVDGKSWWEVDVSPSDGGVLVTIVSDEEDTRNSLRFLTDGTCIQAMGCMVPCKSKGKTKDAGFALGVGYCRKVVL